MRNQLDFAQLLSTDTIEITSPNEGINKKKRKTSRKSILIKTGCRNENKFEMKNVPLQQQSYIIVVMLF